MVCFSNDIRFDASMCNGDLVVARADAAVLVDVAAFRREVFFEGFCLEDFRLHMHRFGYVVYLWLIKLDDCEL